MLGAGKARLQRLTHDQARAPLPRQPEASRPRPASSRHPSRNRHGSRCCNRRALPWRQPICARPSSHCPFVLTVQFVPDVRTSPCFTTGMNVILVSRSAPVSRPLFAADCLSASLARWHLAACSTSSRPRLSARCAPACPSFSFVQPNNYQALWRAVHSFNPSLFICWTHLARLFCLVLGLRSPPSVVKPPCPGCWEDRGHCGC